MNDANAVTMGRRKIVAGVCAVLLLGALGIFFFMQKPDPAANFEHEEIPSRQSMSELSRQPRAERDAMDLFEDRLNGVEASQMNADRRANEQEVENARLRARLEQAEAEKDQVLEQAGEWIEQLEGEMASLRSTQQTPGAGRPTASPGGPGGSVPPGQPSSMGRDPFLPAGIVEGSSANDAAGLRDGSLPRGRALQSISFAGDSDEDSDDLRPAVVRDPERYVPPNSYASARVLVGVDAATGTSFGADPKPVLFRITGPAISVLSDGELSQTDIEGCLVNGAAYGELSSEKVYVQLQRMTCPLNDGSGRVTESAVEGYVAFGGKAGVRGRVISREGDLTERALIAGTLQGLGASLSRVGTGASALGGLGGVAAAEAPSTQEIAVSSIGGGLGNAAAMLSQYYIERAEEYQPVIEMPTGVDVEIVFLSGVIVR